MVYIGLFLRIFFLSLGFLPYVQPFSVRISNVGNYEIRPPLHVYKKKLESIVNTWGGNKTWRWKGQNINYFNAGNTEESPHKSPLLLIHGAVASSFHWRNNIPVLAEKYNVFALDLVGMGLSDKPRVSFIDYGTEVWTSQVLDFIQEVIGTSESPLPCVVAGTCVGGPVALAAAASQVSKDNNLISGCVLLNSMCRFVHPSMERPRPPRHSEDASFTRAFLTHLKLLYTETNPSQLWTELPQSLYFFNKRCVDDALVESIRQQYESPEATSVMNRLVAKIDGHSPLSQTDDMLEALTVPLLLVWGTEDVWVRPKVADRIQLLYPQAQRVDVRAGHSPHDEAPKSVNAAIDKFMQDVQDLLVLIKEGKNKVDKPVDVI